MDHRSGPSSHQLALDLEDGSPLAAFHDKLNSFNVPIGNAPAPATANLRTQNQKWLLTERLREILESGGLYVGFSKGFNRQSSYLHIGCHECRAVLHIYCPYLTTELEQNARRIGAIDWHLANFLFQPGEQRHGLAMCTAERAWPGAKHGDAGR